MPRPFRRYGNVVIIDHGGGWTSVITDLAALEVAQGAAVRRGAAPRAHRRGQSRASRSSCAATAAPSRSRQFIGG